MTPDSTALAAAQSSDAQKKRRAKGAGVRKQIEKQSAPMRSTGAGAKSGGSGGSGGKAKASAAPAKVPAVGGGNSKDKDKRAKSKSNPTAERALGAKRAEAASAGEAQPAKKRRASPGMATKRAIKRMQRSTTPLLCREPFRRLAREETALGTNTDDMRWKRGCIDLMRDVAEAFAVDLYTAAYMQCNHRGRLTLETKDVMRAIDVAHRLGANNAVCKALPCESKLAGIVTREFEESIEEGEGLAASAN